MAYYLLNFTKKAAAKGVPLRDQAASLLETKLWGIGPKAPNRDAVASGDRLLIYVGAPECLFVGQATLANGYHEWTPEEATAYSEKPAGGAFPAGVTFGETEVWNKAVPIDSVWSEMPASESNPNHLFY